MKVIRPKVNVITATGVRIHLLWCCYPVCLPQRQGDFLFFAHDPILTQTARLTDTTTPVRSEAGNNGNERVFHTPQFSRIEPSPPDEFWVVSRSPLFWEGLTFMEGYSQLILCPTRQGGNVLVFLPSNVIS